MTGNDCVLQPALVTEDLRAAAEQKAEELFSALVTAKNDWQYAVADQDAKYERVLRLKAEYAEWRGIAERLGELLAGMPAANQVALPSARSGAGFSMLHRNLKNPAPHRHERLSRMADPGRQHC